MASQFELMVLSQLFLCLNTGVKQVHLKPFTPALRILPGQ